MTTEETPKGATMHFHDPAGDIVPFEVVADVTPVEQTKGSVKVQIDFGFEPRAGFAECWACGFKWVVLARKGSIKNGGKVECPSCHYHAGYPWEGAKR